LVQFDFHDQVAIITGGTGNLGSAVVRAFKAAGAHIAAPDRSTGKAHEVLAEIMGSEEHLVAEGVDVTNPDHMEQLARDVAARFGKIDILVNTVGGFKAGSPLHETPLENWDFLMNLNARSVFITCRAVLPYMLQRGRGKIVNIGSHSALSAHGNDGIYSAAKSAVLRLTESMAVEYKNQGIQVNAVLPSALTSPADLQADPTRGVTTDSVAQVILFLCSDAGSIINGAAIPAYGRRSFV